LRRREEKHTSNKTLLISDAQMKEIFIISARSHASSPAARIKKKQTTEQLFFQTFLLHPPFVSSLSSFCLEKQAGKIDAERAPGEEIGPSNARFSPHNTHYTYTFFAKFARGNRIETYNMQIVERRGQAGCISGPPKALAGYFQESESFDSSIRKAQNSARKVLYC